MEGHVIAANELRERLKNTVANVTIAMDIKSDMSEDSKNISQGSVIGRLGNIASAKDEEQTLSTENTEKTQKKGQSPKSLFEITTRETENKKKFEEVSRSSKASDAQANKKSKSLEKDKDNPLTNNKEGNSKDKNSKSEEGNKQDKSNEKINKQKQAVAEDLEKLKPHGLDIRQEGSQWVLVSKTVPETRTDITYVMNEVDKYNRCVDEHNAQDKAVNDVKQETNKVADKHLQNDDVLKEKKVADVAVALPLVKDIDGNQLFNPEAIEAIARFAVDVAIEKKLSEELEKQNQKNNGNSDDKRKDQQNASDRQDKTNELRQNAKAAATNLSPQQQQYIAKQQQR